VVPGAVSGASSGVRELQINHPSLGGKRLLSPWTILLALICASIGARAVSGLRIGGLWIVPDEMIWGGLGRRLWEHGDLKLFGQEQQVFGVVYPALVGGPLSLAGLERGYDLLKIIQPIVMSATAVPVYLWARRLSSPGWSLLAAALTLAVPGLLYSGLVMSETVFYPALVLAAWATAAALEEPTRRRQALLVVAVVLAAATRLQAIVLPVVVLTAAGLHAVVLRDVRRPLRLWLAFAAFLVLGAAWLAWRSLAGGSPAAALGSYSPAADAGYDVADVLRFTEYHAAALLLLAGLFPACAVALLAVQGLAGRERSPAFAAYVATALSLAFWLVLQAGAFTSVFVRGFSDRYLLPLAPVLFVGFAAWLARGAPRPRLATAAVVLAAFGLLAFLPLRDLIVQTAAWQSLTVVPLIWLRERWGEGTLELVFWLGAGVALAAFALVPRRALLLLPAVALALLVVASVASTREVIQNVAYDQQYLVGGRHRWVDRKADQPAAYLYAGEFPLNIVWHQLFWNDELEHVYALGGLPEGTSLPLATTVRTADEGRLVKPDGGLVGERYVVAVKALELEGEPVDEVPIGYANLGSLRLWRVAPPARIRWILTGVREAGDMHEPGVMDVPDCRSGRLYLTLLPKISSRVELKVNGTLVRTLHFHGEEFVNLTVRPPPGVTSCRFEVIPDSTLGSTRFEFVRD
jgi:hypothetical protein